MNIGEIPQNAQFFPLTTKLRAEAGSFLQSPGLDTAPVRKKFTSLPRNSPHPLVPPPPLQTPREGTLALLHRLSLLKSLVPLPLVADISTQPKEAAEIDPRITKRETPTSVTDLERSTSPVMPHAPGSDKMRARVQRCRLDRILHVPDIECGAASRNRGNNGKFFQELQRSYLKYSGGANSKTSKRTGSPTKADAQTSKTRATSRSNSVVTQRRQRRRTTNFSVCNNNAAEYYEACKKGSVSPGKHSALNMTSVSPEVIKSESRRRRTARRS